jgi:hypothetical protein
LRATAQTATFRGKDCAADGNSDYRGGGIRTCAITSASECCAELGRLKASNGEPAFPRPLKYRSE